MTRMMSLMAAVLQPVMPARAASELDTRHMLIEQVITHRIYARQADKTIAAPDMSSAPLQLPRQGLEAIQQRLTTALSRNSHGVEMSIEAVDEDRFFQYAADAIRAPVAEFVEHSKAMALQLTQAQSATTAKAGILLVITGRVGDPAKRFLAIIKAESHDGFGSVNEADAAVAYLRNLSLTPSQRLYKAALLLEEESGPRLRRGAYSPSGFRAFLFDHLITATETRSAAAYFYSAFLGMDIQKSARKLTQQFYETTVGFIASASLSDEQKSDAREALRSEMRSSRATISAADFAQANLPISVQSSYETYLVNVGFPSHAISKDTAYVTAQLRKPRKLSFEGGVKVVIPADAGADAVTVVDRTAEATVIRIAGRYVEN